MGNDAAQVVSMDEAVARVRALAPEVRPVTVPVGEAQARTLARSLVARIDVPRSDVAAMDGFAVRAADTMAAGSKGSVTLRIVGGSYAGDAFDGRVGPGEAVAIATGAHVPQGADAILVAEAAKLEGDVVHPLEPATPKHIRRAGEDVARDVTTLEAGIDLDPARVGLAAMMGFGQVVVAEPPKVALVVTGSEVGSRADLDGAEDSNGPLLAALVQRLGGRVALHVRVADDDAVLREALDAATATGADLVVSTGGASVGRFDLVRRTLPRTAHGFERIAVRPGAPTMLGAWNNVPWLALPGTPVAVAVVGGILLASWAHAALGRTAVEPWRDRRFGLAQARMRGGEERTALWLAVRELDGEGRLRVREVGLWDASRTWAMQEANALIVLPPGASAEAGTHVATVRFPSGAS